MNPDQIHASVPVVIVHWNQADSCLETVSRFLAEDVVARVDVVDNGSTDEQLAVLRTGLGTLDPGREEGSRVNLIETGQNLGFGPGANVGLRRFLKDGSHDWVVLTPHDVDPAPGCLLDMLRAADAEPMSGLMCADVGDGMVPVIDPYFGGMVVPSTLDEPELPRWEDVDFPHGTLMMLRRECLAEVGLFDERFFSYCEEADLAIRARTMGWKVGLVRGARVTNLHIGSGMWTVDYLQTRNTLLLVREYSGRYHAFIRACITIGQVLSGTIAPSRRPLIFDAQARLRGLADFLRRRFGPPPSIW